MPRGGARPGAGRKKGDGKGVGQRPPKRKVYESPIREAEGRIRDRLPELVDMALKLALEGEDAKMVVYCIDRILGKPTQPFDFREAARRAAEERGLNPDRVIHLYEQLKRQKAG